MLPAMRPARQIVGGLGQLLPVALCALAAHVAVYRSLVPSTGGHAYLGWYESVVAGLSIAAVVLLATLLLAAAVDHAPLRRRIVSVLLPGRRPAIPPAVRIVRLSLAAVAFLVCQETLERTLSEGRLAPAAFSSSQTLLILVVIAAAAAVVAFVERSCSRLIELVARALPVTRRRVSPGSFRPAPAVPPRRRIALAELRGLRAPPLAV
jgi:hypothetical protein